MNINKRTCGNRRKSWRRKDKRVEIVRLECCVDSACLSQLFVESKSSEIGRVEARRRLRFNETR